MRLVVLLVLALGLALAGTAVYLARGQIGQMQSERERLRAEQARMPPLADVVVTTRALAYGEKFTAADLASARVQADRLPKGAFRKIRAEEGKPEAATAVFLKGETRPRAAMRAYEPNEILTASRVTAPGVDTGIMSGLGPNMRAFTIQVDRTSGVSGFLRPGDHVDVYWSGTLGERPVTKLIDSNLKLIAVDQSADADRSAETQIARAVTAEVTPEQVAALTLAQATGRLTLSLVGMRDTAQIGAIEIDRDQLLGVSAPEQPQVAPRKSCSIRTRRGGELVETEIPCAQ